MNSTKLLLCVIAACVVGCVTGRVDKIEATAPADFQNSVVVNKKRADVWAAAVPRLAKTFFVINNIDQSSGLINVSYSGDPEQFVDGGTLHSHVENAAGARDYSFPATSAHEEYEHVVDGDLVYTDRRMSLEGRANVILEELGPEQTRVTANVRYVLTKTTESRLAAGGSSRVRTDTASFNSGQSGMFARERPPPLKYYATGKLEQDILRLFTD